MGEIADMMVTGELCESCGVYVGEPTGYPQYCSGCRAEQKQEMRDKTKGLACPLCGPHSIPKDFEKHARNKHPKRYNEVMRKAGLK